jgi:hypothetical protein
MDPEPVPLPQPNVTFAFLRCPVCWDRVRTQRRRGRKNVDVRIGPRPAGCTCRIVERAGAERPDPAAGSRGPLRPRPVDPPPPAGPPV